MLPWGCFCDGIQGWTFFLALSSSPDIWSTKAQKSTKKVISGADLFIRKHVIPYWKQSAEAKRQIAAVHSIQKTDVHRQSVESDFFW